MRFVPTFLAAALTLAALPGAAVVYSTTVDPVDFDRWMYPFNGTPGTRTLAPTFGAASEAPDFDNRDGQVIVAIDTEDAGIPKNQGATNYHPLRIRIFAAHFDGAFSYDPTYDAWQTYLDPSHPSYVADSDAGRPIELYGVGFRNGYVGPLVVGAITAAGPPGFEENNRYCEGCGSLGQARRNVFALDPGVPDPEGDVSNNVVRMPPLTGTGFDPSPWAIGKATSGLAAGAAVPQGNFGVNAGETFVFELNLADPDVLAYVRNGLNAGVLGFAITSMHETEQQAGGTNPNFYMRDNVADTAAVPPRMELIVSLPEPGVGAAFAVGAVLLRALGRGRSIRANRARSRRIATEANRRTRGSSGALLVRY
jgi:hypothetical protein